MVSKKFKEFQRQEQLRLEEFGRLLKQTGREIAQCAREGEAAARRFDRTYERMMRGLRS